MAGTIVTVPPLPSGPRPAADHKLALLAAGLVTAARAGDEAAVGRLLDRVEPYRLVRLFLVLGAAADRDAVLVAAGFGAEANLRRCYGRYRSMRNGGVDPKDMPAEVVEGYRMYQRLRKRRQGNRVKAA